MRKPDHIIDVPDAEGIYYCCGDCHLECGSCKHKGMQFVRIVVGMDLEEVVCPACACVVKVKRQTPSRTPVSCQSSSNI